MNSDLKQAVRDELDWDTRVENEHASIAVEVEDGIVTLTGRVGTCAQRSAAQDAAHRVRGVLDVVNELEVAPVDDDRLTDLQIAHALREAFVASARLPHEHIHTTVSDGVVTLEGHVPFLSQRDDADALAQSLRGVRQVKNFLRVEPPAVPENALKQAISRALMRHAEHAARHVTVAIDGHAVTLSGDVRSAAERVAIVGAIRGMPGIATIEDHMHVR